MSLLHRDYQARDLDVTGRTLTLACVPFDTPTPVVDGDGDPYLEQFAHGAFRTVLRGINSIHLRLEHRQDGPPYAYGLTLREDPDFLIGQWRVADSSHGEQLLALVRDGQLRGVSVGFVPGTADGDNTWDDNVLTRRYVKAMPEVSLTPQPAYPDARVLELRHQQAPALAAAREREWWTWNALAR
jgi:hypothetical protein